MFLVSVGLAEATAVLGKDCSQTSRCRGAAYMLRLVKERRALMALRLGGK